MEHLYKAMLEKLLEDLKSKEITYRQDTTIMLAIKIACEEIKRKLDADR
jgi:hypothetical protein